jgi:hypothetical protein
MAKMNWKPTHIPVVVVVFIVDKSPNPTIVIAHPIQLTSRYFCEIVMVTPPITANGAMARASGRTSTAARSGDVPKQARKKTVYG